MKGWDIIGDIHGHSAKLEGLLAKLGYRESGGVYRHPQRRVLFLGDYIDRGPDVRRVLQIVRAMVEAGEAVALAGNHEVNAVHYHTKGPNGQPLRPHSKEKAAQHAATLEQFADCPEEWNEWLGWFSKLPLFFETEDFRAIHACWSDKHIENVRNRDLTDTAFLFAAADKHQPEGRAVEILIKGPELALPPGVTLRDKNGTERKTMRVRTFARVLHHTVRWSCLRVHLRRKEAPAKKSWEKSPITRRTPSRFSSATTGSVTQAA